MQVLIDAQGFPWPKVQDRLPLAPEGGLNATKGNRRDAL